MLYRKGTAKHNNGDTSKMYDVAYAEYIEDHLPRLRVDALYARVIAANKEGNDFTITCTCAENEYCLTDVLIEALEYIHAGKMK